MTRHSNGVSYARMMAAQREKEGKGGTGCRGGAGVNTPSLPQYVVLIAACYYTNTVQILILRQNQLYSRTIPYLGMPRDLLGIGSVETRAKIRPWLRRNFFPFF
jgi:hypothetical protein